MKVKIFLGEYTYIYRGVIDLKEMNEFIKTLTNKAFVIKWKDQDDDLITISKKQDLVYFYQQWTQNSSTNKQSFRLFVHEIPLIIHNAQTSLLQQQSQIYSKMYSPSSQRSLINLTQIINKKIVLIYVKNSNQQQGISQFTFGLQLNEQSKSQEHQKDRHSQQINLQSILEIQGSSINISNKNLDKVQQQNQQNEDGIKQRIPFDFNNIHAQDLSFFMNMDMKQSINKKGFTEMQMGFDDDDEIIDNKNVNEIEMLDSNNIYCDYCSDKILCQDEFTIIYTCQFCEDFHVCKLCFDQYQEQVHVHQLQDNILQ